ncbi:unnamed protein product [Haemonchus placei]|uniref:Zf-C2HC5 domain-containing protein n=1 Tax=Haemonchus placei TaxID=6290 RepID=A0A0N4W5H1_HAEPC|nr:unnamed protein product [Haemonchus placei]
MNWVLNGEGKDSEFKAINMGHRKDRKGNPSNRGGAAGGVANRLNTLAVKAESAIGDQLLPVTETEFVAGRHPCNCQARIHALVRNCMGCGKIVCVQEGSGPCFFCGTLVCTKEEKEVIVKHNWCIILDRGSRKSAELYSQLMGTMKGKNSNFKELSLSTVGAEFQKATQFRNKLLAADADS